MQVFAHFFLQEAVFYTAIIVRLYTMRIAYMPHKKAVRIAYIPFGVTRPLLDEFCRTHSTKHASERVYTTSLAERGHIPIRRGRRHSIIIATIGAAYAKCATCIYPAGCERTFEGDPIAMGEEVESSIFFSIAQILCQKNARTRGYMRFFIQRNRPFT